jgi:hypothetical protein
VCEGQATAHTGRDSVGAAMAWEFGHRVVSPTHKRTKGRAPVWGSEFTSKDATLQGGGPAEIAAGLNAELWNSVVVTGGELPPIEPNPLFESI